MTKRVDTCETCRWFRLTKTNAGVLENQHIIEEIKSPGQEKTFRMVPMAGKRAAMVAGNGTCHYTPPSLGSGMGPRNISFPTVDIADFCRGYEKREVKA